MRAVWRKSREPGLGAKAPQHGAGAYVVGGRERCEVICLVEVGEEIVPHSRGECLARVLAQGLVDVRRLRRTPRCSEHDHGGSASHGGTCAELDEVQRKILRCTEGVRGRDRPCPARILGYVA